MPGFQTHILAGGLATAGLVYARYSDGIQNIDQNMLNSIAVIFVIYSILPDIDHKASKVSALLHIVALSLLLWVFNGDGHSDFSGRVIIITIFLLEIYHWLFAVNHRSHRKFPHTITFLLIMTLVLFIVTQSRFLTLIGFVCCSLHLLLDRHFKRI